MVIRMRADGKTIIFLRAPRGWCRGTSLVFLWRATALILCPLQQQQLVLIWASFLIILLDIHLSYSLINFLSHGVFTFLLIFLLHLHVSSSYVGIVFFTVENRWDLRGRSENILLLSFCSRIEIQHSWFCKASVFDVSVVFNRYYLWSLNRALIETQ